MANTTTNVTVTWGNGRSTLLAGTPLDAYGNIANNSSAYGILAADMNLPDRTATVITAGEWDEEISRQNGIALSDAAKTALSGITFKNPVPNYATVEDLEDYVLKTDKATKSTAGIVKMAEAVADSEEETSPTTAEFNALLSALRTAGILETPAEPENSGT